MRPVSGRTGIATAKSRTSASAQMKSGTASRIAFKPSMTVSPIGAPHQRAGDGDAAAEHDRDQERQDRKLKRGGQPRGQHVGHSTCSVIEVPKSPWTTPLIQIQNCVRQRRVEPIVRLERRDVGRARARRDHHRDRIAGHDAQQNEDDDRHARKRDKRHCHAIGDDRKQHQRSLRLTASMAAARPARRRTASTSAFRPSRPVVGCRAPETFGVTLRSDL